VGADQAADAATQALEATMDIDDPVQRAQGLSAQQINAAVQSSSDSEIGRRALELLLLTSNAIDCIAAFPTKLLRRIVEDGLAYSIVR
jgi:hypothetical protein